MPIGHRVSALRSRYSNPQAPTNNESPITTSTLALILLPKSHCEARSNLPLQFCTSLLVATINFFKLFNQKHVLSVAKDLLIPFI